MLSLLVLKKTSGKERAEGLFRHEELSVPAMFHPSMISEKPGLLWEFWLQLSLGSTERPGQVVRALFTNS